MATATNTNITADRTFSMAVGYCPKCGSEVEATGRTHEEAVSNLGRNRTCGRASCEAYADSPHMVLTDNGWVDTRPR